MNCKKCGTKLTAGESFCTKCGTRVDFSDAAEDIICPICETLNSAGSTHCAVCGEALPQRAQRNTNNAPGYNTHPENVFCAHCGAPNPPSNNRCSNCGRNLNEEVISPSPSAPPSTSRTNSYTPIIIGLTITAVLAVVVALVIVLIDSLQKDSSSSSEPVQTVLVEVTHEPMEEPTEHPTPIPTPRPTPIPTPAYNSSYSAYNDYDYAFSCPYPNDMYRISPLSDFTRLSLGSYNGGKIYICGTINDNGRSAAKVADNFKTSYNYSSTIINDIGSNYCSVLISDGYTYHYCYYSLTEGMIRGFEMEFDNTYYGTYMDYADYMRTNISL